MLRTTLVCLTVLLGIFILLPAVCSAEDTRSLDEQLLDEFDTDPLEDAVDDSDADPARPTDDARPGKAKDGSTADDTESKADNPLLDVARRMREVEDRIGRADAGAKTRELQKGIVADLDSLLEQARKACKPGKPGKGQQQGTTSRKPLGPTSAKPPGGGKSSDNPATESSQRPQGNGGEAPSVDAEQMSEVLKKLWGELPRRQREQMSQWQLEEFLPKYELLIEEYFRRLSRGDEGRQE